MNENSIFIGIDSGGTRTNVLISSTADLEISGQYEVGESLSGAVASQSYPRVLHKILTRADSLIARNAPAGARVYVFISAAGFSVASREEFMATLRRVCPDHIGGRITAAGAANDAVSLIMGLRAAAVVIAGTGSNIVLAPSSGFVQIGGHNWVACDQGSGFWIGLGAIRRAFRDLEAGTESTLLERLYETYGIHQHDTAALIEKAYDLAVNDHSTKRDIARFAASVCGAAERGDVASQNIVKAEAEALADLMAVGLRRHFLDEDLAAGITVVQAGSVMANEFYRASFENQLEMRLRSPHPTAAELNWKRVWTGLDAAIQLAQDLAEGSMDVGSVAVAFRPVVIRF
jgi:N-acetylglucosamine kinase-like BadF-type ATPase